MVKNSSKKITTRGKVFVGLSGGVDSSVSCALLQKEGYEVTAVFIKTWHPDFLPCTWKEDRLDAMRVAAHLGIPFVTLDLEKEYKENVADYMIEEYKKGRTPNPDVMCNKNVKFGAFLKYALENGADFVATGHYSRIEKRKKKKVMTVTNFLRGLIRIKTRVIFFGRLLKNNLNIFCFRLGIWKSRKCENWRRSLGCLRRRRKIRRGFVFWGSWI